MATTNTVHTKIWESPTGKWAIWDYLIDTRNEVNRYNIYSYIEDSKTGYIDIPVRYTDNRRCGFMFGMFADKCYTLFVLWC
jgi:hypothetical protein